MLFRVVFVILSLSATFAAPLFSKEPPPQPPSALGPSIMVAQHAAPDSPHVVTRGDEIKHCPPTYEPLGKLCVKIVKIPAVPKCEPGAELTPEGICATYTGKIVECPEGFDNHGSVCEHREKTNPSRICAIGYTLTGNNECTAPIQPPSVEECVNGSIRRGDLCIREQEEEPKLACPANYKLEGKKCRIEELYNCTPERSDTPTAPPIVVATALLPAPRMPPVAATPPAVQLPAPRMPPVAATPPPVQLPAPRMPPVADYPPTTVVTIPPPVPTGKGGAMFNINPTGQRYIRVENSGVPSTVGLSYIPGAIWRRNQARLPPASKEFAPELTDYVLQATCKRIRKIVAEKVCERGVLSGKMCLVEVEVPPVTVSGPAFENDVQLPQLQCPKGYFLESNAICVLSESRSVMYVCPLDTKDVGDRCASYSQPKMTCPPNYALENNSVCVQNLEAPPITEYTVRYQCTGKDCANNQ